MGHGESKHRRWAAAMLATVAILTGCGGDSKSDLIPQVQAAWNETYAGLGFPAFTLTDDNGSSNITVVTQLGDSTAGREEAMGLCRAFGSLGPKVSSEWNRIYVTAGSRGAFLAECQPTP